MAHAICSVVAPPPEGWNCVVCHKGGEAFDLITLKGCDEKPLFHRACYAISMSAVLGRCQKCLVPLHERQAIYIPSGADVYRMPDFARHFKVAKRAKFRDVPFDKNCHKRLVRSASWNGPRKKATPEQIKRVCEHVNFGWHL